MASQTERVASELRRRILSGELAPGLRIRELRFAPELGVSRTPMRLALAELEREGLLERMGTRGIKVPGQPNIADTLWLTVSDQKNRVSYYQDTNSPSIVWVRLADLDFGEGSGPRKLQLDGNPDVGGDQTRNFRPAALFRFMVPKE
jgi:DNA-binding transcriptional MocR family regulator